MTDKQDTRHLFQKTTNLFNMKIDDRGLLRSAGNDMDAEDKPLSSLEIKPVIDWDYDDTEERAQAAREAEETMINSLDDELDD